MKELVLTSADDSTRGRPPLLEKAAEAKLMFPKILKSPGILTKGVQECLSGESFYFDLRFGSRPSLNVLAPQGRLALFGEKLKSLLQSCWCCILAMSWV